MISKWETPCYTLLSTIIFVTIYLMCEHYTIIYYTVRLTTDMQLNYNKFSLDFLQLCCNKAPYCCCCIQMNTTVFPFESDGNGFIKYKQNSKQTRKVFDACWRPYIAFIHIYKDYKILRTYTMRQKWTLRRSHEQESQTHLKEPLVWK